MKMRWLLFVSLFLPLWGCVEKQTTAEKRPEITGRIVINVTDLTRDPLTGIVVVKGKLKNFSNLTLQSVSLRFEFYDRNNQLIHTETRPIIIFERFRPNDIRAFSESFFDLPLEARYVNISIEDFAEAW
jgi:hypothetical protein